MNAAFRKQLFEAAERAAYPVEPVLDEATGVAAPGSAVSVKPVDENVLRN